MRTISLYLNKKVSAHAPCFYARFRKQAAIIASAANTDATASGSGTSPRFTLKEIIPSASSMAISPETPSSSFSEKSSAVTLLPSLEKVISSTDFESSPASYSRRSYSFTLISRVNFEESETFSIEPFIFKESFSSSNMSKYIVPPENTILSKTTFPISGL